MTADRPPGFGSLGVGTLLASRAMQVDGEVSSTSGSRKVGWDTGGDSLYSRQGGLTGPQVGTAHRTDFAIDSVGIIIADLNRDTMLDAYVSDLGDNEVPLRRDSRFEPTHDTGAANIRSRGPHRYKRRLRTDRGHRDLAGYKRHSAPLLRV